MYILSEVSRCCHALFSTQKMKLISAILLRVHGLLVKDVTLPGVAPVGFLKT